MSTHLWEMDTAWFVPPQSDMHISYTNWKNFQDNTPDIIFKNHIMISWAWSNYSLQLVFSDRNRGVVTYVQVPVTKDQEEDVRAWIKKHKPSFWDL